MEEKKLLKIALICSLLGTALLYFISTTIEQQEKSFSFVEDGEYSVISGEIEKINSYGNVSFIKLYQKIPVDIVIMGESHLDLRQGNIIEARGTKEAYEGKKEFVADEIRILS